MLKELTQKDLNIKLTGYFNYGISEKIKRSSYMVLENLKSFLQKNNATFELITHKKPIYSSEDGVKCFGIDIAQTAPIIIIKVEKSFFAVIVSGERGRINLEFIVHILGYKKGRLATKDEVTGITGFHPGSIPLVGHNLPCIFDKRLFRYPFVYGGSGEPTCTLKINPKDLEKLNKTVAKLDE